MTYRDKKVAYPQFSEGELINIGLKKYPDQTQEKAELSIELARLLEEVRAKLEAVDIDVLTDASNAYFLRLQRVWLKMAADKLGYNLQPQSDDYTETSERDRLNLVDTIRSINAFYHEVLADKVMNKIPIIDFTTIKCARGQMLENEPIQLSEDEYARLCEITKIESVKQKMLYVYATSFSFAITALTPNGHVLVINVMEDAERRIKKIIVHRDSETYESLKQTEEDKETEIPKKTTLPKWLLRLIGR